MSLHSAAAFNPERSPVTDPLGTVRIWPRWQDKDHVRELAIRWCSPDDRDEAYPWLLLGSDGPQKLSNDAVEKCAPIRLALIASELGHADSCDPLLGCATTRQLFDEIMARIVVDGSVGGRGLSYRPADHDRT